MSDIVDALRSWVYTQPLYQTAIEAAEEIERLRNELDVHRRALATINAVHAIKELLPPPPFMTAEERKSVEYFSVITDAYLESTNQHAAMLRSFLERTK